LQYLLTVPHCVLPGSAYWTKIMEQKEFMRSVQKYREKHNGQFPPEPPKVKLKRLMRCQASQYTAEHIAYVAGLKARKVAVAWEFYVCWSPCSCVVCVQDVRNKIVIAPPPKARVQRVGPRPKNLVRLENYNKAQKRKESRPKNTPGSVSSR
jgi:hypothetical protein